MLKKVTPEDLRRYLVVNRENGNANYLGDVLKGCLIYDIAEQEPEKKEEEVALLFATETCPNCKIACNYMDKAGFTYRKLIASENAELAKSLGIKQAPTLVLPDGTKFAGAGAIKAYVSQAASKIA